MSLITIKCPECKHPHYITEDYLECCILTCNCYGGEDGESITAMSTKVAEYLNNTERKKDNTQDTEGFHPNFNYLVS